MSSQLRKRFWKETTVTENEGGYGVALDGRAIKTPNKNPLLCPTRALAEAVAAEWDAQEEKIDPASMPVTRAANSAIERVTPQYDEVHAMLAAYAETDLLCYRADYPEILAERQAAAWDPLLDWAEERFGARLTAARGVMYQAQDPAAEKALSEALRAYGPFEMTGIHELIGITGSLVLALAIAEGRVSLEDGWAISRIDESFQAEQWGEDKEADEVAQIKLTELRAGYRFMQLAKGF